MWLQIGLWLRGTLIHHVRPCIYSGLVNRNLSGAGIDECLARRHKSRSLKKQLILADSFELCCIETAGELHPLAQGCVISTLKVFIRRLHVPIQEYYWGSCFLDRIRLGIMRYLTTLRARLSGGSTWLAGTWLLEIAAAMLSLGCLVVLFIVLSLANGKTIMVWHGITLNTLASILATASKLSALYVISASIGQTKWNLSSKGPQSLLDFEAVDCASRGALGCIKLLWQTRKM